MQTVVHRLGIRNTLMAIDWVFFDSRDLSAYFSFSVASFMILCAGLLCSANETTPRSPLLLLLDGMMGVVNGRVGSVY